MLFNKGDTVQIRDDLIVGEDYGLYSIKMLYDMKDCRGMTGTVTDTMPEELAVKVGDWWWSEIMVKAVITPSFGKWTSINDALPENDEKVVAIMPYGGVNVLQYMNGRFYIVGSGQSIEREYITHWMPLPKLP